MPFFLIESMLPSSSRRGREGESASAPNSPPSKSKSHRQVLEQKTLGFSFLRIVFRQA